MDTGKLDLSPLDPSRDEVHWERLIGRITDLARPELSRRAAQVGVLSLLGNWAWPTLAAAGIAAVLSAGALAVGRGPLQVLERTEGIVHALDLAEPVTTWLDSERAPTKSDLILAIEGESR
jgi:hypothetical protein